MGKQEFLFKSLVFSCTLLTLATGMAHVRLSGSKNPWEGRVEVFHNGTWGTICSGWYWRHWPWDSSEADVVCRELGFFRSRIAYSSSYLRYGRANSSVPVWLTGVNCNGKESTLLNCSHNQWGTTGHHSHFFSCSSHYRDVGVMCMNITTRVKTNGNCDFEFLDMCNYTQDTAGNDETDWKLRSGLGSPNGNKPSGDHTTGLSQGSYYVIVDDQRARLISPVIQNKRCISFYYNLYGQSTRQTLNVYVKLPNSYPVLVWMLQESSEDKWELGRIPLNGTAVQIIFEGIAPKQSSYRPWSSIRGSVSLDDITVSTHDSCTVFPGEAKIVHENPSVEIRLVGGSNSSGRVQVWHEGKWGRVCGDYDWDMKEANVVCKNLGFKGAEAALRNSNGIFGKGKGLMWLQRLRCIGFEPSLAQCSHDGWGKTSNCGSYYGDAAVVCTEPTDYMIRLNGSSDTPFKGRVELNIGGIWAAINEQDWDIRDGNVACRELGFAGAHEVSAFNSRNNKKWFSNLNCLGNETSLGQCNHTMMQYSWYQRDAGVECYDIRLTDGRSNMEGRVEVQYEGVWGTVCNKNWDKNDADVVCRTLGFDRAKPKNCCPRFGEGTGPIVIDDAQCTGTEIGLSFCKVRGWGLSFGCTHAHDVGVACEYILELNKVEIVLNATLEKWNKEGFLTDLVDRLNTYCGDKDCGYKSNNKTQISTQDAVVSRVEYQPSNPNHLLVEVGVTATRQSGSTMSLSRDVLFKAISQKPKLGGYQVLLIDNKELPGEHHYLGHHKSSHLTRTIVIAVVVTLVGFVLIAAFLYFVVRRNRIRSQLRDVASPGHVYSPLLSDENEDGIGDIGGLLVPPVEAKDNSGADA